MSDRERFKDFHQKRMEIFRELVKYMWQDTKIHGACKDCGEKFEDCDISRNSIAFYKYYLAIKSGSSCYPSLIVI